MSNTADRPVTWAVVAAAGAGERFGGGLPKQFVPVAGVPLLHRTLLALWEGGGVDGLVVVVPAERVDDELVLPERLRGLDGEVRVCAGGRERTDSVRAGFGRVPKECRVVLVHDGARPVVGPELVQRVRDAAWRYGACVPVVPAGDTVKRVDEDGRVVATLDRSRVRLAQTPQGFRREVLERAFAWLDEEERTDTFTDDAALVEASGQEVRAIDGDVGNLKVTVPRDLSILGLAVPRVGFGYDVHELVEGRPLMLGGVRVPCSKGLLGHSDGDVALHALCDAVLGAAGLGDIGRMFPDDDPAWASADSLDLLRRVVERVVRAGWAVSSADLTIVAQRPKLAEHLPVMAGAIAGALGVESGAVGCKATTEEGLGVTGDGRAIAAHAVAVLVSGASRGGDGKP